MDESIEETTPTAPSTSGNQGTSARSTTTPADELPLSNIGAGPANVTYFKGADMEYFGPSSQTPTSGLGNYKNPRHGKPGSLSKTILLVNSTTMLIISLFNIYAVIYIY
ncbi:unnamed protein product, partial [Meganyctiphanes norvegica]